MRRLLAIAISLAAVLAGSAGARTQVPSGDTCSYSANGGTYSVEIVAGSGIQQFGYAFGIPGQNGSFTTSKLPPSTTGAWISDAQLTGTSAATLTVSGSGTGPVVIVPAASAQASYYDPVTCAAGATEKSLGFTVGSRATYSRTAGGWHLVVSIPTAGTVSARQPLATSSKVKPKPLVQAKREALNSRGKVTLLLKATPQGQAVLNA